MNTKMLMTVEEFSHLQTGETEDYELVDGELIPLASPTPRNCEVRDSLADLVRSYFRGNRIGRCICEVDCRVAAERVRRPDVSIFLGERLQQIDMDKVPVPFAPDIAVEVLSPSEGAIDVHGKVNDYLAGGSQEVWLVDHVNGEVLVYDRAGKVRRLRGDAVLESPLLPGFAAPIAQFFAVL